MDTTKRTDAPEIRFERVPDVDRRLNVGDLCPSCGAFSPLYTRPYTTADGKWSIAPSRFYGASRTSLAPLAMSGGDPCHHWLGIAATPDEVRALLPRGGVARARHATDALGEERGEGVDSRWRCWRLDDNGRTAR